MKYIYPAIFKAEEDGGYSIRFPDIECCYTSSETLEEGIENARDVLTLMLYDMEERKEPIPHASDISALPTEDGEFTTLITADTMEYRRFFNGKAVKKTLSIPAWLNTIAERENVNFSAVLQKALKAELNI